MHLKSVSLAGVGQSLASLTLPAPISRRLSAELIIAEQDACRYQGDAGTLALPTTCSEWSPKEFILIDYQWLASLLQYQYFGGNKVSKSRWSINEERNNKLLAPDCLLSL